MSRKSRPSAQARVRNSERAVSQPELGLSAWRRALDSLSDSLREHPTFDLNDSLSLHARPDVVEAGEVSEVHREPLYQEQWLRIFLVRLRLSAVIGIFSIAAFVGFYRFIFPEVDRKIWIVTAMIVLGLSGQAALTRCIKSLIQARVLAFVGFSIFSLSSAVGLSLVYAEPNSPQIESARAVQFIITASYAHILITSLIMPLRLSDTLGISGVVICALSLGLRAIPVQMKGIPVVGAIWAIGTFAFFVTLLSHFNSRLRRRVFDSAFDLALQALEMKQISETDALTKGFNRRHSERVLSKELVRSARFSHPLSLLMFDLDNFKPVNDTLGHGAGDLVLIAVHEAAHAELREVDDLARIGGDEFLILLPETDQTQAKRIARRLHSRVTRELKTRFGDKSLLSGVTISVGALTLEPGHNLQPKAALEYVDSLLYQAKKAGKNRVIMGMAEEI